MKRVLFVTLMASFCFTISCASKKKSVDPNAVTVEQPAETKTAQADSQNKDQNNQYTCLVAGDERVVTLNKADSKCTVDYTKEGNTQEVAWAQSTPNICTDTFDKIRNNIEGAGFKCGLNFDDVKKEEKPVDTAKAEKPSAEKAQ